MFDFTALPVVDNHLHPYLIDADPLRYTPLDTFLGLPGLDADAVRHRDAMVYQMWATRLLAGFLGCEPTVAAVAAARAVETDERVYAARLFADARVETLVVDTGYPQPPIDLAAFRATTPVPVAPIYRIEPAIKTLLDERVGYAELVRRFDAGVRRAVREEGYVGLKSVIAYRTGLDVDLARRDEAAGRAALDAALTAPASMALSKPLRDHLFCRSLELCRELDVPLQVHTGFGDGEIVLGRCNPALLNDVLQDATYRRTRVVLIHCYPFLAEASWLAAALPNVWCDLSLGIPFAPLAADRIVATLLELAPTTRILAGSDAFSGPEQVWLGARLAKAALGRVLADAATRELLTEAQAGEIAAAILAGNARALYRLPRS